MSILLDVTRLISGGLVTGRMPLCNLAHSIHQACLEPSSLLFSFHHALFTLHGWPSLRVQVTDLHAVTPACFLDMCGGSVHALSYQQARNNRTAVGQVRRWRLRRAAQHCLQCGFQCLHLRCFDCTVDHDCSACGSLKPSHELPAARILSHNCVLIRHACCGKPQVYVAEPGYVLGMANVPKYPIGLSPACGSLQLCISILKQACHAKLQVYVIEPGYVLGKANLSPLIPPLAFSRGLCADG